MKRLKMNSTLIKDEKTGAFIEQDCTIELQGHKFTSGGAFIAQRKDTGKFEGYVYAQIQEHDAGYGFVTSWAGDIRRHAYFSRRYYHNFGGTMRHVWFKYNGMNFHGQYCDKWNECVHVKQVK